ncbi:MAG TPA: LppP/LprE family lipoprotein [Solirubrobacteraceae bacterium]|nr:LppP/LprE family lipoprotein [Solirubrobacteraceae bacterium]HLM86606.1 LppP/LprE family lipoprotein [Solirubrobacteraceae bacterium]
MRRDRSAALAALALTAALAGCGSQTKTVSVAESPPASQTSATASTATSSSTPTKTAPASTAPAPTSTAGGAAAPGGARTAPEPAFTHQQAHAEGLSEAVGVLKARGYTPNETSQYHSNQTLRVLIGTKSESSDGYDQQAFFFLAGRYIGTDTKQPSATVKVVSQSDTEVTLAYPLYRSGDPLANPSGGQAIVHFQLNDGKLTPLQEIPPASSASGLSRG